ncbi:MAG: hydroxysqualene dehydroxylase HpnE [Chloroflexota bacterium]|nr:hydroxysqualene dehydroxylase HpnE [Chloroflexota bacterium]
MIGGGLAGIAAACALADRGVAVTLLEKRPYLGGRAFSFQDSESGHHIDNGQHIYLACCTAYTGLLRQLGVLERTTLQRHLRAVIVDRDGRRGALSAAPLLPSPLHLLPSFLTYPHLSLGEKLRAASAMLSIMRTDRTKHREVLEAQTFRDWLVRRGQSDQAIAALWDLLTLPVFNDTVDRVSAYMGLMFFQDGMLAGRHSADIGVSTVGLTELVEDAARGYLEARGGEVLTGRSVTGIATEDGAVTGVVADGELVPADAVVAAVPWDALARLLPAEAGASSAPALEWAPIINVHVWYDRPVIGEPFLAVLDSPLQWVFNRSHIEGVPGPGQHVCISVSGAWDFATMSRDALRELFLDEMARVFPAAAEAAVERFTVVRQVNATFRCTPGAQSQRPEQSTAVAGLGLAGDWTQTGWPATMESAVRSGRLAAEAVFDDLERGGTSLASP